MARRVREQEDVLDVRGRLEVTLAARLAWLESDGRERIPSPDGGCFVAPHRMWLERLQAGVAVTVPAFIIPGDVRSRLNLSAGGAVTVARDGSVTQFAAPAGVP